MLLIDYLDGVSLIHLPERRDRYIDMKRELRRIHIPLDHPKFAIPHAPIVDDADGFPSRGVRGNFLSHLEILREARDRGDETVMVLEDDAIFRAALAVPEEQDKIVATLQAENWGICFLGHPMTVEIGDRPRGLIPHRGGFKWAHCYVVHARALGPLVDYLEATMERPVGDPLGGRLYIDGALSLFRDMHTEIVTLVANPSLSHQRGSPSSLAGTRWFDRQRALATPVSLARRVRDEMWRMKVRRFA